MGDAIHLDPVPVSVGRARRYVSGTLRAWGVGADVIDTCTLLVSELATNAVLHARTPFTVRVSRSARVRVEVDDEDPRLPHPLDYSADATSGRGLHLIVSLSTAAGAETRDDGKTVWFELDGAG